MSANTGHPRVDGSQDGNGWNRERHTNCASQPGPGSWQAAHLLLQRSPHGSGTARALQMTA